MTTHVPDRATATPLMDAEAISKSLARIAHEIIEGAAALGEGTSPRGRGLGARGAFASAAAPSMISCAMRASDFEIASASISGVAVARSGTCVVSGSFSASLDRVKGSRGSLASLSDRANHTGPRLGRWHTAVAVGAIVLLSAVARFLVARSFDVPWIAPDEMIYGLVGQSLWETGTLASGRARLRTTACSHPLLSAFH